MELKNDGLNVSGIVIDCIPSADTFSRWQEPISWSAQPGFSPNLGAIFTRKDQTKSRIIATALRVGSVFSLFNVIPC